MSLIQWTISSETSLKPRTAALACTLAAAMITSLIDGAIAQSAQVPTAQEQITLSFAPLVREAAPAVVNITASRRVRTPAVPSLFDDPFFRRFFGESLPLAPGRQRPQSSLGSGVIVSDDGMVVTNHHVIDGATEIRIALADRREFDAELLLSDERTDLAFLQLQDVEGLRLPTLPLGESDDLEVGDLVLAIGNPFGVGQTVTSGIVSAEARTGLGISDFSFFIQTDAAINPGNSGGALVAMDGTLVGINTAIFSRDGGSLGIGFAVPSTMVRALLDSIDRGQPLARPWLGAGGQPVTADLADALGLGRPAGVMVNSVEPGSPAGRAGLRVGDVVIAVGDTPVDDPDGLRFRIATSRIGRDTTLTVHRGEREVVLALPVELPPEIPPRDETWLEGRHPFAGALVANLSPALREAVGHTGPDRDGVIVLDVAGGSPADRINVRPMDVVLGVNGQPIGSVDQLERLMNRATAPWRLQIRRGDRVLDTTLRG